MVNAAIHRVIEQQAAMQPHAVALIAGGDTRSYRELNQHANTLARRLAESGLTRGSLALVKMERGIDLAVVLLAVLKAGAAYMWIEPGSPGDVDVPAAFAMLDRATPGAREDRCLAIDIRSALAGSTDRPSANLPILTRGSDIACVLPDRHGRPHVFVPHETITSMPMPTRGGAWTSEPGAFDLLVGLMSGEPIALGQPTPATAAA